MSSVAKAWLQIHACVVLWGITPILGKLITLPALPLVIWRMALVTSALLVLPRVWRALRALPRRSLVVYAGIGALVALHWLTFYASIKLANASVAATCMALVPVFVSLIEPLLTGRGFEPRELVMGLFVVPGVALVVGGTPDRMNLGIAVGVVSALLVAIFGSLNKRWIEGADALCMTAIEMAAGGLLLASFAGALLALEASGMNLTSASSAWLADVVVPRELLALPAPRDFGLLLILALACTLLPFTLSLVALRHLSAYATALAVNLEPIYAILLAVPILGEQQELSLTFYIGAAIILGVVFCYPLLRPRLPAVLPASPDIST